MGFLSCAKHHNLIEAGGFRVKAAKPHLDKINPNKGVDQTYKVHHDAYDMTDMLSGKGAGQRKEIFYFDDSGSLNAFRYGDWKITFATKNSWWADIAKPRTVPLVVNPRADPFDVTPDAGMYTRRYGDKLWIMVPAQAIVGQFLQTFKEFPQRRNLDPSTFNKSSTK
jgi:hypothetical protein